MLYHRIIEAFKWAYAKRTEMGDPEDSDITEFVTEVTLQDYFKLRYMHIILHNI